ncbi:hypothetical protein CO005_01785, partial [Candidatus Roizmanbacteria bacterium CG_4_8_14_3_um_filter_34_9]
DPKKHLRLSNSLSKDIEYLRMSLLPSLLKNIKENSGKTKYNSAPGLRLFEIAKVYIPVGNKNICSLPQEIYRLGIAVNTDYSDLKGIIEAIYKELNINFEENKNIFPLPEIIEKSGNYMVEVDFQSLIDNCQLVPK